MTRTCFVLSSALVAASVIAAAQTPAIPGAPPAGLVVGSGNFFSPLVSNLERSVAFYRDGLGLEVGGSPANADENAPLRNMFGLPAAQIRWTIARPAGARNGVEIVEISKAGGRALNRRVSDAGAMTLVISTSDDFEAIVGRLKAHGGVVLGATGTANMTGARAVVVRDPDDHFVELLAAGRTPAPLPPRIRLAVRSIDHAMALYRDTLGLRATTNPATADDGLITMRGVARSEVRTAALEVPGSTLVIEFIQFTGASPRQVTGRIQDAGSTRLQLQVRDLEAATQAIVRAGGRVVSAGGRPIDLPAGRGGSIRAVIVQDPDNLFLVLIEAPQPRT